MSFLTFAATALIFAAATNTEEVLNFRMCRREYIAKKKKTCRSDSETFCESKMLNVNGLNSLCCWVLKSNVKISVLVWLYNAGADRLMISSVISILQIHTCLGNFDFSFVCLFLYFRYHSCIFFKYAL